jgi:hypothetical protein
VLANDSYTYELNKDVVVYANVALPIVVVEISVFSILMTRIIFTVKNLLYVYVGKFWGYNLEA